MTEQSLPHAEAFRTRDFVGWEVVDRAGDKIGTVSDLLIDRSGRIRFLDAEFGFPRKHVLLPQHQLEWGERRFIVGGWGKDQIRDIPPYDPGAVLTAPVLEEMTRAYPWFYSTEAGEWSEPAGPEDSRVIPLAEAKDFKLQSGAPDLRGWNVFASDGERVGTVASMLVDPAALKVRYLDVALHEDLFHLKDNRHVLIPLEYVDLKERGNDVWTQRLTAAEVARLPAYTGGAVPSWMQRVVVRLFG